MYLKSKYLYEVVPSHASQYQSTLSTHISWAFKNPDSANIAKNQIYLAQYFGPKMSSGTQEGMSAFLSKYWKGWHVSSSKSHCQFPFFLAHWRLLCRQYLFLPAQVLVTLKHFTPLWDLPKPLLFTNRWSLSPTLPLKLLILIINYLTPWNIVIMCLHICLPQVYWEPYAS